MIRRISFFGLGYVGLTTAACFASRGFEVWGFDIDEEKLKIIGRGEAPIYEPGLEDLLRRTVDKTLFCTSDPEEAVLKTDATFITVGTPSREDGSIDLSQVENASEIVGRCLSKKDGWHLVVVKSTVTPGTCDNIVKPILEESSGKKCGEDFGLCMNPEFLREGNAVSDTFNADRIIIGEYDRRSGDVLETFYRAFYGDRVPPILRTNLVNAELIKYANNAFLAMKVSFANMFANLCQEIPGADVEVVMQGIGLDRRIGPLFLRAGLGWGGSCWPKDLSALLRFSENLGIDLPLVRATIEINDAQPLRAVDILERILGDLGGKLVAILGLSFKPNTDDIRNAVSLRLIEELLRRGARVRVYDPAAMKNARRVLGDRVEYARSSIDCLDGADCCIIVTEWDEFRDLKPEIFSEKMRRAILLDGRRVFDPETFENKLEVYVAVGRYPRKASGWKRS